MTPRSAAPPARQRVTAPRRTGPGFVLLGSVQVTLIFALTALSVPLPQIGAAFGLGRDALVLLSAAYGLSFAGLLLFGGRLTDRWGGRRPLTVGLLLFAVASLAVPLAPGYAFLVAVRLVQGAAAAVVAPAALAVLRTLLPEPREFGRAMATWGGLSLLGAACGTVLSGPVASYLSWRWTFVLPAVVATAAALLAPAVLPPDPPGRRPLALDVPGAVLATAGVVLATWGLVATEGRGWGSVAVWGPLGVGLLLLTTFLLVELRTRQPLLPPAFLLDLRRGAGLAATAVTAAGTSLAFLLLALGLQQDRGWSAAATSLAFLPYAAVLLLTGRFAGGLTARVGPEAVTALGLATGAVGLATLALADPYAPYPTGLLPGLLLLPAGASLSFSGAAVLATRGVPPHRMGLAGGVLNTAMEVGAAVGLAVLLTAGSDSRAFAAAAGCYLLSAVATAIAPRVHRGGARSDLRPG